MVDFAYKHYLTLHPLESRDVTTQKHQLGQLRDLNDLELFIVDYINYNYCSYLKNAPKISRLKMRYRTLVSGRYCPSQNET